MKNIIFFFIFCFFYCGCISNNKELEKSFSVIPKENIYLVLDSFVRINNCEKNCFEIYIDKQSPQDYLMFIYTGTESLTYKENKKPIMHTMVSGIKFDIYSGVENFFEISGNSILKSNQSTIFSEEGRCVWVVIDSAKVITVKDYYFAYPFIPLPINSERYFMPLGK